MSGLQVNEPGMLALVQDFGRFGWLAQGIVAVGGRRARFLVGQ